MFDTEVSIFLFIIKIYKKLNLKFSQLFVESHCCKYISKAPKDKTKFVDRDDTCFDMLMAMSSKQDYLKNKTLDVLSQILLLVLDKKLMSPHCLIIKQLFQMFCKIFIRFSNGCSIHGINYRIG